MDRIERTNYANFKDNEIEKKHSIENIRAEN